MSITLTKAAATMRPTPGKLASSCTTGCALLCFSSCASTLSICVPMDRLERNRQDALREQVSALIEATYLRRQFPRRLGDFLVGQFERVDKAVRKETEVSRAKPTQEAHTELRETTGSAILAIDGALRSFGAVDAKAIAKRLADVAQAAATGAELVRKGEPERGKAKWQASTMALRAGGGSLSRLETLGKDLGEVVDIGVRRMDRAANAGDFPLCQRSCPVPSPRHQAIGT